MGAKLLCFCLASALVSYYIYTPIPENIEEGWKVMLVTSLFRTVGHVVSSDLSLVRAQESTLAWGETDPEQWMLSVALWAIDTWQYIPVIHV